MVIGDRLKTLREAKDLSQGDIEKRTENAWNLQQLGRKFISTLKRRHSERVCVLLSCRLASWTLAPP